MSTNVELDKWLIVRSGFRQTRGTWSNGCVDLMGLLSRRYGGGQNRVELETWDANPHDTVEYIYHLSPKQHSPTVGIFAYSWGCGYGAMTLAREFRKKDIDVRYMVLCDPVYHGWRKWRALCSRILFMPVRIQIPSNVNEVWWLRQHVNRPSGHDLVAESPYTVIHAPLILQLPHDQMDNSPEFHSLCMAVAARLFEGETNHG